jgi:hypothetical protein
LDSIVSTNGAALVTNFFQIVMDEVPYSDGGRWGQWADGGGSSLERIDPRANPRLPSNWADSNETAKAPWKLVTATGTIDNGNVAANQLQVLLQGAGECLIDNVQVLSNGVNLVANLRRMPAAGRRKARNRSPVWRRPKVRAPAAPITFARWNAATIRSIASAPRSPQRSPPARPT